MHRKHSPIPEGFGDLIRRHENDTFDMRGRDDLIHLHPKMRLGRLTGAKGLKPATPGISTKEHREKRKKKIKEPKDPRQIDRIINAIKYIMPRLRSGKAQQTIAGISLQRSTRLPTQCPLNNCSKSPQMSGTIVEAQRKGVRTNISFLLLHCLQTHPNQALRVYPSNGVVKEMKATWRDLVYVLLPDEVTEQSASSKSPSPSRGSLAP